MNNKILWLGLGIVVAVFLAGSYMSSGSKKTESTPLEAQVPAVGNEDVEEMKVATESSAEEKDVREIVLEASNFEYSSKELVVNPGETVRITFKVNQGGHNLVIDGLGVESRVIKAGEETVVDFTASDTPGELSYYCSVGNHRALGMEGVLTIE